MFDPYFDSRLSSFACDESTTLTKALLSIALIIEPAASNVAILLPGEIIVSPSKDEIPFVGKDFFTKSI